MFSKTTELEPYSRGFQTILSQNSFTLLKIIENTKELLFTWIIYILLFIALEIN